MVARRLLSVVLVAGLATGCSTTGTPPSVGTSPSASGSGVTGSIEVSTSRATSTSDAGASSRDLAIPRYEALAGPDVAGAFDAATDGIVIAWSSGTVDVDAPELWVFDPATGERRLAYRSDDRRAILANLAVRHGILVFAEVVPRGDDSRTWHLVLVDRAGTAHRLDDNDVPPDQVGVLPMAAISDRGVLWATSHAGDATSLSCELRYASLADLEARTVRADPCREIELWYPRSDGRRFIYGTVEYRPDRATDARHVYVVTDGDLDDPVRLDADGEASLPAILDTTVIWKAAPRDLNMFTPGRLVVTSLSPAAGTLAVPLASPASQLTTPSIGRGFYLAEDAGGASVPAWDRARVSPLELDRVAPADPGFLSGARLAGDLAIWFYTSSTGGGGTREIRWLVLPGP